MGRVGSISPFFLGKNFTCVLYFLSARTLLPTNADLKFVKKKPFFDQVAEVNIFENFC
jgi:hypothetical protein